MRDFHGVLGLEDFTNLGGGDYTLEVRARRGGGGAGPVTTWDFSVLTPAWRSAPALLGYVLAAVVCAGAVVILAFFASVLIDASARAGRTGSAAGSAGTGPVAPTVSISPR